MPTQSPFAPEQKLSEKPITPEVDVDDVEEDRIAAEEEAAKEENFLEEEEAVVEQVPVKAVEKPVEKATIVVPPVKKDEDTIEVEKILEDGLAPMFVKMPDDAKEKFKEKGEIASHEIASMVKRLQLDVKKVLRLIRDWLLTIPKVNKFFLEQDAKIKTDRIIELVRMRKEEKNKLP
jgi:hypothetical protein